MTTTISENQRGEIRPAVEVGRYDQPCWSGLTMANCAGMRA